ncbi:MAG: type II secretion system protein GspM [Pseudomonadota bacterium]
MLQSGSLVSRTLALAILVALVLGVFLFAIEPAMSTYQNNRDEIARSKQLLQRYEALIAERPGLIERIEALDADDSNATAFLENTDEALAGVELQDLVSAVVDTAGGSVKSIQVLPAIDVEEGPPLRKSGVKLRFSADIDMLAETLFELETMEPLLFIDQLQVTAARTRQGRNEADMAPELDVRIDVFSFARLVP